MLVSFPDCTSWNKSSLGMRLINDALVSQARPNQPLLSVSRTILKVIRTGVGWVWLVRLTNHALVSQARPNQP